MNQNELLMLPCISIKQPWAHLIINGHITAGKKDVENRTWNTKFRGLILIHASLHPDKYMLRLLEEENKNKNKRYFPQYPPLESCELKYGGIIGIARITDCIKYTSDETKISKWHEYNMYGFKLENARPVVFHKCKGKLGIHFQHIPAKNLIDAGITELNYNL